MSHRSRDIGLGYTNLGACLMALGYPYDSDRGRNWAAAVTGLLTGAAAVRSTELSERLGAAPLFSNDTEAWTGVYRMHLDAAVAVPRVADQPELNERLTAIWRAASDRVQRVGARNAELTVAAPTGTISFMMDADTTGIEPDLGLVKFKKLVGGGTMQIVNQTVPRALERLSYGPEQIREIVAHIAEHHTILGAPHLDPAHLPVFACAIGDNTITYGGHLRMMAAIQPFFSGAMSKTVNVPEETTAEDLYQLVLDAWQMGIKCVAVYRDNCKVAQPLTTKKESTDSGPSPAAPVQAAEAVVAAVAARPTRERLPRARTSRTFEFRVADCSSTACRCRRSSTPSWACGSSRPASPTTPSCGSPPASSTTCSDVWRSSTCRSRTAPRWASSRAPSARSPRCPAWTSRPSRRRPVWTSLRTRRRHAST